MAEMQPAGPGAPDEGETPIERRATNAEPARPLSAVESSMLLLTVPSRIAELRNPDIRSEHDEDAVEKGMGSAQAIIGMARNLFASVVHARATNEALLDSALNGGEFRKFLATHRVMAHEHGEISDAHTSLGHVVHGDIHMNFSVHRDVRISLGVETIFDDGAALNTLAREPRDKIGTILSSFVHVNAERLVDIEGRPFRIEETPESVVIGLSMQGSPQGLTDAEVEVEIGGVAQYRFLVMSAPDGGFNLYVELPDLVIAAPESMTEVADLLAEFDPATEPEFPLVAADIVFTHRVLTATLGPFKDLCELYKRAG